MTAPEPTDYDRDSAADVVTVLYGSDLINYDAQVEAMEIVARALAAAVAAEREKYVKLRWDVLTIANELAMIGDTGLNDPLPVRSAGAVATDAARRIREVSR